MGAASSEEPMRLCARSISSAPVTTRRTVRTLRHFSASASLRHSAGTVRKQLEMHRAVLRRIARQPRLLGGERQHRREPRHRAAEQVVDHRQAGAARQRRDRIAIERVLADVEIEGREVDGHEGVERGDDALVVEVRIVLAHLRVELGEPVQHQPFELRHARERHAVVVVEMRERAEHPADGVAQLAVGFDGVLEDLRADAQVVGSSPRRQTHSRRMSAPDCLITSCGAIDVAERLRHLAAVLVEREAVGQHHVERRTPRVPQDSSSEDWNQPRCWSEPSRYITVSGPPSRLRWMPARPGKCSGSSSTKACVEPESNQTSRMSSTFAHSLALYSGSRKRARRAGGVPGVGAFLLEGVGDALVDALVLEDFDRAVVVLAHEHGDRHAPGALARDHPVGLAHRSCR